MRNLNKRFAKKLVAVAIFVLLSVMVVSAQDITTPPPAQKAGKGFLGVNIRDLNEKELKEFDVTFGVLVVNVTKDLAADKAGIKLNDVIQFVDETKIATPGDLVEAIRAIKPGSDAKIKLVRDKKAKELTATIGKIKADFSWSNELKDNLKYLKLKEKRGYLGVTLQDINDDLGAYFNVKGGAGVLIVSVAKESPAEKAGLKAGDVILELDGKKASDPGKISKVVGAYEKGDKIELKIIRHKKTMNIKAELGELEGMKQLQFLNEGQYLENLKNLKMPEYKFDVPRLEDEHELLLKEKEHEERIKKEKEKEKKKAEELKIKTSDSGSKI